MHGVDCCERLISDPFFLSYVYGLYERVLDVGGVWVSRLLCLLFSFWLLMLLNTQPKP